MCEGNKVVESVSSILKYWTCFSIYSIGKIGGLIIWWIDIVELISSVILNARIQTKFISKKLAKFINTINIDGP